MTGELDGRWKLTVRKMGRTPLWEAVIWRQYQDPDTGKWSPDQPSESAKPSAIAASQKTAMKRGTEHLRRRSDVGGILP